jgi:hypothetical protein
LCLHTSRKLINKVENGRFKYVVTRVNVGGNDGAHDGLQSCCCDSSDPLIIISNRVQKSFQACWVSGLGIVIFPWLTYVSFADQGVLWFDLNRESSSVDFKSVV